MNAHGVTKNSFIFSFKGIENVENHVLSCINDEKFAIYYGLCSGPEIWKWSSHIWRKVFLDGYCYCERNSYEKQTSDTREYEVQYSRSFEESLESYKFTCKL